MLKPGFDARLESVRGIAALAVAISHGLMVLTPTNPSPPLLDRAASGLGFLLPAGGAVVVFFVLSGTVLGLALERDNNFSAFAVRRLFRIVPAFWLATIVAFAVRLYLTPEMSQAPYQEWFQRVFWPEPVFADLGRNLLMKSININPVSWTMLPEMLCSLLMPLLVVLHARTNLIGRLAILLALWFFGRHAIFSPSQYLFCFYLGFLVPIAMLAPILRTRRAAYATAIAGFALIAVSDRYGVAYTHSMRGGCALGAALLIGAIVSQPHSFRWLHATVLRFMGRISFSFYLLHLTVLFGVARVATAWPEIFPPSLAGNITITLVSIGIAIALATLFYACVERPGILVGRLLAQRIRDLDGFVASVARRTLPQSA